MLIWVVSVYALGFKLVIFIYADVKKSGYTQIVTPGGHWSCGLCDGYKSRGEDTGATDRTPGDSMTSSQNTGGQWNSTASGGKKKLTHTRGLKEVVKQEEASLEDSKSLQTASHEGTFSVEDLPNSSHTLNTAGTETSKSSIDRVPSGETGEASRRSKRGRPLKSTAQVLPLKRRRADAGISKAKPDDGKASCSVPEQLGEAEELAVESGGPPVLPTSSLSIDDPASVSATELFDERVPPFVVKTESNVADVGNVGGRAGSINDVDKLIQFDGTKLKDSDGSFQSLAMKDCSPESNAVVALPKVPDISMVQVMESGEFDASHRGEFEVRKLLVDSAMSGICYECRDTCIIADLPAGKMCLLETFSKGLPHGRSVIMHPTHECLYYR